MDQATKKLLNTCYEEAVALLQNNRSLLDEVSEYLLLKETITGDELMAYVNAPKAEEPASEE